MQAGPQRNRKSRWRMLQLRTAEKRNPVQLELSGFVKLVGICLFFCNARARGVVRPVAVWLVCGRLAGLRPFGWSALWPFGWSALWPFGWSAPLCTHFSESQP